VTAPSSPAEALRRRLRDDPAAARELDALRRAAYGRADGDAPLVEVPSVEVPEGIRRDAGIEADALPAPLVALLVAEHRLVAEGRDLLAADARAAAEAAPPSRPAAAPPAADVSPDAAVETADPRVRPRAPHRRRILRPGPVVAVLAGALLVAGLGTASASGHLSDDDSWRSQEPTSTPGPPSTPDPRVGMPVPRFTAEPPAQQYEELTEAATAQRLQERADSSWDTLLVQEPDARRPDVAVERIVDGADWVRQQAACLRAEGVDVVVIGTGDDIRLSSFASDSVVHYACEVRFPLRPHGPATEETLAWLYAYYVDFLIPCYASEGAAYEGEVPSFAEQLPRARAGRGWFPEPSSQSGAIGYRCPQAPDGLR